jgi:hypothetical protein
MKLHLTLPVLAVLLVVGASARADLLPPDRPLHDVVDHYIAARLEDRAVKPAGQADDATLLRRLTLDLAGRIPTAAEARAYLADSSPDKRLKLVERLMASPAFVRHQVNEFDTMLASPPLGGRRGGGSLREYLTVALKDNRPWDQIFRELMLADESKPATKGSSQFLKSRVRDLDRLTTDVSVLFFGVNISCAQCHDHPLVTDWKQDHYYGLKSFFSRTFEAGPFLGERDTAVVQFKTTRGVTKQARLMFLTGKVVDDPGAKALSPEELKKLAELQKRKPGRGGKRGATPPPAPKFSARASLADLALEPGQRDFFARAIVNRVWHRLFGVGLVSPIDQMHSENAPSHPELLAWLARDVAEHKYDLRRLIKGLVLSKTYSRDSRYDGERWPAGNLFAVAGLRALTPMQLATSLRLATTAPEQLAGKPDEVERKIEQIENSARGLASLFEQPRDNFQIGVAEALLFSNSDRIQRELLADGRDRLAGKLRETKNTDELIDVAVRNVFARPPAAQEKKLLAEYLGKSKDSPAEAAKRMLWALLTSSEFRFNY